MGKPVKIEIDAQQSVGEERLKNNINDDEME